jgi:NADH dehydrogenase
MGSHVVMAVGARPNFFGTPGASEHAFPLYSVADAERLRLHLRELLARVAAGANPDDVPLDVVVVGGGPTGVEIAGAVTELMAALHKHERIPSPGRVVLVDRADTVLGAFSKRSRRYAAEKLVRAEVELRLGVGVSAVHADRVELTDGSEIRTRTVVWGGGESAAELAADCGPEPGRGARLDVEPDLRVPGFPGAYAAGDVANIPDASGVPLPQLGSVAQQSGFWVANNIIREKAGRPTEPVRYKDKGIMAMIGRNAAVAEVGKRRHQVDGPVAFAAWLGVHAALLSGAHSRTDAFLSWAWDYFDRDHAATVDASTDPSRIVWDDEEGDRPHLDLGPGAGT